MDKMKTTACFRNKTLAAIVAFGALSGMAEAAERAFTFAVPGVVAKVLVASGDSVSDGQAIAELDATPYKADLAAAEARLGAADAALQRAEADFALVQQLYDDLSTSAEELDKAADVVSAAKAVFGAAKAEATKAKWAVAQATLKAPQGGKVVSVPGFAGQVVDPANPQAVVIIE